MLYGVNSSSRGNRKQTYILVSGQSMLIITLLTSANKFLKDIKRQMIPCQLRFPSRNLTQYTI
jgi:hypothetical protein